MNSVEDLDVFRLAHRLALKIYSVTKQFPRGVAVRNVFVIVLAFEEGTAVTSLEDLDVFKLAHQLALKTYPVTKAFPKEELFRLGDQTRQAAGSVGMNLMEGAKRLGSKDTGSSLASHAVPQVDFRKTSCFD